ALAMALHHYFRWNMSAVYLVSDLVVLALSLTYIPVRKIIFSLITVVLSGQLIGLISKVGKK
ncbi:MAG: YitT family protein, partial [Phoenicibacter congonensis]|nr:YitT family protein [Phoenicibacter congonensis]